MVVFASTAVLALILLQAAPAPSVSPPMAQAGGAGERTLTLSHALRKGETAWLLVKVGAIGREQIEIVTQDGRPLGTISAFGVHSDKAGGIYTVPVPAEALRDGRLTLRLSVTQAGRASRAVTSEEVRSLQLLIRRFKDAR